MQTSNKNRVGTALESLRQGLYPYVQEKLQAEYKNQWTTKVKSVLVDRPSKKTQKVDDLIREDVSMLLSVMRSTWGDVFKKILSSTDRAFVSELIDVRNKWAHESMFSAEDTYRAVDSVFRLLKSIFADSQLLADVERQRSDIFRILTQEQGRPSIHPIPVSETEEAQIKLKFDELLKLIPFQKAYLLKQALTHTSYKYEHPNTGDDNEQLEFLGDALLTFLSGDFLYKRNPNLREGKMTVLRSNLVDASQLAKFAAELDLGKWMLLGNGEDINGGRSKQSLLSNVFEAVIGAYYLDSGVESVRDFVEPLFEKIVNGLPTTEELTPEINNDPKSQLQQIVLDSKFTKNPERKPPKYETNQSNGTDHNPEFTSIVYVAEKEYGRGKDKTKKEAEKRAAEDALKKMNLL